ncbi:hypothetical protein [Macrococcus equi]|uniref:hypothetical protein n=1 Tax=Macrococcus equi TaxID=3395462 RepID=UPI0039BE9725
MDYNRLYQRYIGNYKPLPKDIKSIIDLIKNRLRGYEIPLESWSKEEYIYDDDIDEHHVYKLFHVNDDDIVNEYIDVEESLSPEEIAQDKALFLTEWSEEEWEAINKKYYTDDMKFKHDYDKLIIKHNEQKAFSIILESIDDVNISAFKILGSSQKAFDLLVCYIGIKGMIEGDLDNPSFRKYLECLERFNFI